MSVRPEGNAPERRTLALLELTYNAHGTVGKHPGTNDGFRPRMERIITAVRLLTLFRVPRQRMRFVLTTHPEYLHEVYDLIINQHQGIDNYLKTSCGVDLDIQNRLKERFLTDL